MAGSGVGGGGGDVESSNGFQQKLYGTKRHKTVRTPKVLMNRYGGTEEINR